MELGIFNGATTALLPNVAVGRVVFLDGQVTPLDDFWLGQQGLPTMWAGATRVPRVC